MAGDPGAHHAHRELVAAAASVKAGVRALCATLEAQPDGGGGDDGGRRYEAAAAAAARAGAAAAALRALLEGARGDDAATQRLPALESGRRMLEVDLPAHARALLEAADPAACGWPAPACGAGRGAALGHPLWPSVQGVLADVCRCLALLAALAARAVARAADPAGVLLQLAGAPLMGAAARHLDALTAACGGGGDADAARAAAVRTAAVLAAPYGVLAATARTHAGLGALREELGAACAATGFMRAAAGALLAAAPAHAARGSGSGAAAADDGDDLAGACEEASDGLLALALCLSGAGGSGQLPQEQDAAGAAAAPGTPEPLPLEPGSPQSPLAPGGGGGNGGDDSPLATAGRTPSRMGGAGGASAAAAAAAAARLEALCAPEVLAFFRERLHHALTEMHGGGAAAVAATLAAAGGSTASPPLLPGRAGRGAGGGAAAALGVLLVWRALLRRSPEARRALADDAAGVAPALAVAALAAAATQAGPRPACSATGTEPLSARCMAAAGEALGTMAGAAGGAPAAALRGLLPAAAAAAVGVAAAAAGAWDGHTRSARTHGHDLPYAGQIKCAERGAGEMLALYGHAAAVAAGAVQELLAAVAGGQGSGCFWPEGGE
jgi:hypothetical protein